MKLMKRENQYTVKCDDSVRALLLSFGLTIMSGERYRVVAGRDAPCRRDWWWQCRPSHQQQRALDRVQDRQGCMHHARRTFFAYPLSSCMVARSAPAGSLPSVAVIVR